MKILCKIGIHKWGEWHWGEYGRLSYHLDDFFAIESRECGGCKKKHSRYVITDNYERVTKVKGCRFFITQKIPDDWSTRNPKRGAGDIPSFSTHDDRIEAERLNKLP